MPIADGDREALRFGAEVVSPPAPMMTTVHSRFLHRLARIGQRPIILLDPARVLTLGEQDSLQALPVTL